MVLMNFGEMVVKCANKTFAVYGQIKLGKMFFWVQTTHPAADVFAGYQSRDYAVLLASHQSHGLTKHDVYARKEINFQS